MSGVPNRKRSGRLDRWTAGAILATVLCFAGTVRAQTSLPSSITGADAAPASAPAAPPASGGFYDTGIIQTGCSGCSDLPPPKHAGGSDCGCCGGCGPCKACGCVPGQPKCYCDCCDWQPKTCLGRGMQGFYNCLCCPDPCYEWHWNALHDVAFWQDYVHPLTQTRLRYEGAWGYKSPDRAEFFWARSNTNPSQVGAGGGQGKGPRFIAKELDYQQLSMLVEAAAGGFGLAVETPYLHIDPDGAAVNGPLGLPTASGASGFGDITITPKGMILDCDCIQISSQFRVFIPSGNFTTGLGTGHTSLEPALQFGLKLWPNWYLQMQFAYWIPIGGDTLYQSNVFHMHYALNHVLWSPCPGLKLVGTMELNEWSVCGGAVSDPNFAVTVGGQLRPVAVDGSATIISAGPGVRFVICDKIDFGVGTAFALTGVHWAEQAARVDFRWRF